MTQFQYNALLQDTVRYLRQQSIQYGDDLINGTLCKSPKIKTMNQPDSLNAYKVSIQNCQKCTLSKTRNHFVFGVGNPKANLMIIGEAPGKEEDLEGKPFVGKAGQLLTKILTAVDFTRDEVFICNILKCRPPQNRDPQPEERNSCLPFCKSRSPLFNPKLSWLLVELPHKHY